MASKAAILPKKQTFFTAERRNNLETGHQYYSKKHYVVKNSEKLVYESKAKRQLRAFTESTRGVKNFFKVVYVSRIKLSLSAPKYQKEFERLTDFSFNLNSFSKYERLEYVIASLHKLYAHWVVLRLLACPPPSGATRVPDDYLDDKPLPDDNLLYGADFDFFSWLKGDVYDREGRLYSDIYAEMRPDIMAVEEGELERGSYDGRSVKSGMNGNKGKK